MNRDLQKIFSGSVVIFIGKIINAGAQYLLILILGRVLGPAEVGLFFLGRAIMRLANVGGTFGLSGSLLKFIPEYLARKQYFNVHRIIKFAFFTSISMSVFIAIFLYIISSALGLHFFRDENLIPVLRVFLIGLPLFTILTILLTLIRSWPIFSP